jgi:hypothetical protein
VFTVGCCAVGLETSPHPSPPTVENGSGATGSLTGTGTGGAP